MKARGEGGARARARVKERDSVQLFGGALFFSMGVLFGVRVKFRSREEGNSEDWAWMRGCVPAPMAMAIFMPSPVAHSPFVVGNRSKSGR
eukprot:6214830-Pleurochrysis_carterae.AAC.1